MARSIIVTGASSGIGRATALCLLDAGWSVGLLARRAGALDAVAGGHPRALALPCDVTDPASVDAAFDRAMSAWGRIDALFNNAGAALLSTEIDAISDADWLNIINVNVNGMFFCARAAFARMKAQQPRGGRIINNGSISAHVPRPGSVAYTTSKHAITGMTRSLSLDGRAHDIACGQIDIGNAASDMTERMSGGVPQADGSVRPEPVMDVANVARSVLHMATMPADANVQFMTVMATQMPYIGRG